MHTLIERYKLDLQRAVVREMADWMTAPIANVVAPDVFETAAATIATSSTPLISK